jgi:hypothetical protein
MNTCDAHANKHLERQPLIERLPDIESYVLDKLQGSNFSCDLKDILKASTLRISKYTHSDLASVLEKSTGEQHNTIHFYNKSYPKQSSIFTRSSYTG